MNETTVPTFEVVFPAAELPKAEREYAAFKRLLPQLLATHAGKHVAIHDGQVIDSDENDVALIQRVHARIGYVPIHVGPVTQTPLIERMPQRREYLAP